MKVLFTVCFMLVLLGLAQGQVLNVNCASEPLVVGPCQNRMSGYSYSDIRRRCVNFAARGCVITGNFFFTRAECEEKCKPREDFFQSPFSYFPAQIMSLTRNIVGNLFDLP